MSDLEAALLAYTENEALATLDLDGVPLRVRGGREAQKREAQGRRQEVRGAYGAALKKAAFGVFIAGPAESQARFLETARKEAEVISVDAEALYKRLAVRVDAAMGGNRDFGVGHFSLFMEEIRLVCQELNIMTLPAPQWREPVNVGTTEGLRSHLKKTIEDRVSEDLQALYTQTEILRKALESNADGNVVPVIVTDAEQEELLAPQLFLENRWMSVSLPPVEAVTNEYVLGVFEEIKTTLKKNKKNTKK